MRVHNVTVQNTMPPQLQLWLKAYRQRKAFKPADYVAAKIKLINEYFTDQGLKSALVACSGGVDSSLVLPLMVRAAAEPGSPIKKVCAATLPVFDPKGATNQTGTVNKAKMIADVCKVKLHTINITEAQQTIKRLVDAAWGQTGESWAAGQLVAYTRTPALYYSTSLLTEAETLGVICGTTNRDEGCFLGYVGKASDGMVDVQIIADLHKSEVYAVARHLNVPEVILAAPPTGDMFDGRTDEEVFGVSYEGVELYLAVQENWLLNKKDFLLSLTGTEKTYWTNLSANLRKLHSHNKHKYIGYSPAVHLDIRQSGIQGGWPDYGWLQQLRLGNQAAESRLPILLPQAAHAHELALASAVMGRPAGSAWHLTSPNGPQRIVGRFDLPSKTLPTETDPGRQTIKLPVCFLHEHQVGTKAAVAPQAIHSSAQPSTWPWHKDSFQILPNALSPHECQNILHAIPNETWVPVGLDGRQPGFDVNKMTTGSKRASCYNPDLAKILWRRLAGHIPMLRHTDERCPTAWAPHAWWQAVGVSPLFRFISYDPGQEQQLVPHYDETYVIHEAHRTLMSCVLYLTPTSHQSGGQTRFLQDPQANKLLRDWNRADWAAPAPEAPIHFAVAPEQGQALVFDHYLLHDALPIHGTQPKIIVRTDIEFIARNGARTPYPDLAG